MMVSFVLPFFPRGVLDEILNLIEPVSEGSPSYSLLIRIKAFSLCQSFVLNLLDFSFLTNCISGTILF